MATLFYYKYSASMFLNRSEFKVPSQIFLSKNAERQFFDKNKQVCLLIIASVKAFDSLLSTLSRYYHSWSTKI